MSKNCSNPKCIELNPQPKSNFWGDPRNSDGLQSQCKTCKTACARRWSENNKEKIEAYENSPERKERHKQTTYAWRERNKDHYNAYMRQANKEYYPRGRFLRYGITKEQHEAMLSAQEDRCYTCRKTNPSTKRCLALDHNDASGVVRGILCYGCNRLLHAFDNVDKFLSIMNYLAKTDPNQYSLILESLNGTKLQSDRPND